MRERTLLDAVLDVARSCAFDQVVLALGGAAGEVAGGFPAELYAKEGSRAG